MSSTTKKVAFFYGIWVLACTMLSAVGYGDGKAGHLYLAISGIPLAPLSLRVVPNGSVFATFVAGLIGWVQWCFLAEVIARWKARTSSKG